MTKLREHPPVIRFCRGESLNSIAGSLRIGGVRWRKPGFSGCWCRVHVEGEGFGVGVVVAGVALQGERDG